ncbi:MAG TPA: ABC transporter permease [Gaiellaceae bacterium]|nr:ABC transporter permease [Gaiellaceae bacterium]
MNSLRVFFLGGLTSFRALFGWVSPWIYIPTLVIAPLFQILLFAYIGRTTGVGSDKFFVVGNALQYASIPCLFAMTNTIAGERYENTLAYILVSPAGRISIFLGRALPVVVNGAFVAALSLLLGGLVLSVHVPAGSLAPLAFVVFVTAYSCTGLGLISAGLGLRIRETAVLANVLFGVLLIFTGANVPLHTLPEWMQTISGWLPITHGIEAARRVADGASLADVSGLVAKEAALGTAFAVLGFGLIRFMEREARRRASIEVA